MRVPRQALLERIRIARDEQDPEFRIAAADRLKKAWAIHFRHHHIGDNEVDRAVPLYFVSKVILIACILQRASTIKSAGGYLRSLTRKAEAGEFSLRPVLMALINTRRRDKKIA